MPTCRALAKGSKEDGNGWRQIVLREIFQPDGDRRPAQQLADQFASFATTIQTRLDANGAVNGSLGGSVEVQVERAIAQVVRTPSVGGPAVGAAALPAETAVLAGRVLPPRQDVLRQEARQVVDAALTVVGRLQPVVPNQRAASDVELYRVIVQHELKALVDEFARPNGPRVSLVRVLLGGLVGWNRSGSDASRRSSTDNVGDVEIFTRLLEGGLVVPTRALEELRGAVGLLATGGAALVRAWERYAGKETSEQLWAKRLEHRFAVPEPAVPSFADRMARAAELAPVIAQDAALVSGALDAISFDFAQRQSDTLTLHTWVDADVLSAQNRVVTRVTTLGDILDWADSLASGIPLALETAGQLGLNLVADHADELFWLIEAIYGVTSSRPPGGESRLLRPSSEVPEELTDAQVRRGFLSLARDLDELADLAFSIKTDLALGVKEVSTP